MRAAIFNDAASTVLSCGAAYKLASPYTRTPYPRDASRSEAGAKGCVSGGRLVAIEFLIRAFESAETGN